MHVTQCHALVAALWQDVLRGALKVGSILDPCGYELSLVEAEPSTASSYRDRRVACIETVLRGAAQKAVCVDMGICAPTVAEMLRSVLSDMGLKMPFSRVPIALPLLAHAATTQLLRVSCNRWHTPTPPTAWRLVLSPIVHVLEAGLSLSERDVVARYIQGESYASIALQRRTSVRTVANQLAYSFKKLGDNGRFGVIANLVKRSFQAGLPLTLSLQPLPVHGPARHAVEALANCFCPRAPPP